MATCLVIKKPTHTRCVQSAVKKYAVEQKIGEGAYGEVFFGREICHKFPVAIKVIDLLKLEKIEDEAKRKKTK